MQEELSSNWLAVDFFEHNYRISGRVYTRQRKLADQLIDESSAFLQLEDAYISNIERPADIVESHTSAVLRKDGITAAVVVRGEDGLLRELTYGSYLGTRVEKVYFLTPFFEIEGYLRLSGKLDLRTVLTSGRDDFITLLDGQMRPSVRPDLVFTGGAILVNKDHVDAFWVEENPNDG